MTPDELRAWMTEHDYTYRSLADALGCSTTSISAWLDGSVPINRRTALALESLSTTQRA